MSFRNIKTVAKRRLHLEKIKNKALSAIAVYPKELEKAQYKNCENMIGAVSVPVGIAGPLKIKGEYAKGEYYLPLATTEGALVASINRGCKAVALSGGAKVKTRKIGITRAAVFETKGLSDSFTLKEWLEEKSGSLRKVAESTSSHLRLEDLAVKVIGRNVFIRLSFDTSDAMGMNMATIATEAVVKYIYREKKCKCLSLAANFDVDKKPSWLNFILGRGKQVWAEAVLSEKVVSKVLKTTPEKIHRLTIKKCLLGSSISGSLGFNAHFANVVASLFLATGQDVAHIVEGSMGITSTEIDKKDLSICVHLPDLPVGSVGGGTSLPCQKEALSILGIAGGDNGRNAAILAEVIGGAVLAGEISLLSSLAEGTLVSAHRKLARGKA